MSWIFMGNQTFGGTFMLSHISLVEFTKHFEKIFIVSTDKLARASADLLPVNLFIKQLVEFSLDRVDFGFEVGVSEFIVRKSQNFLTLLKYRWLGGIHCLFGVHRLFIDFLRRYWRWQFSSRIWNVSLAMDSILVGDSTARADVKISTEASFVSTAFSCWANSVLGLTKTVRRFYYFKSLLSHVEYSYGFLFSLTWLSYALFWDF